MTERSSTENEVMFLDEAELAEAKIRAAEGYAALKSELEERAGGRKIRLLCATKTVDVRVINHLIDVCGLDLIGENRVQELTAKWPYLSKGKAECHFIGTLQTNKVKYIIDKVDMIESVGSLSLVSEIERQAARRDIVMDVLAECNIGRETNKSGIFPEDMDGFCSEIIKSPHLRLRGVMTMAPKLPDEDSYKEYFKKTYEIFVDISRKNLHNINAEPVLSMGMSGSWRAAADCGSTEIRVGTAVFGERKR